MTDLFTSSDNDPIDSPATDQQADPNKSFLTELVGEGKRYKDPEVLARSVVEKDSFIDRLQRENAGLRDDLRARQRLEEIVDRISSGAQSNPPSNGNNNGAVNGDDTKSSAITPEQLEELINNKFNEKTVQSKREGNLQLVEQKLKEAFGANYKRTITERAAKLELGTEFLNRLASEQPGAFLKLFDVEADTHTRGGPVTPPQSSLNTNGSAFRPNAGNKTQRYYEDIRKTNPSQYWSPAVQNEMHREAIRQGEAFFDVT